MKKIINQPQDVVSEMLAGLIYAYGDLIEKVSDFEIIQRKSPKSGKVALVSGGGSGHEPAHAGFVGEGMLSAAVCGAIFTSPTPDQIYEAIKSADEGAGVLLIIKNYSGDVMNFEIAREMAEMEEIKVEQIIVDDDIAVENSLYTQGRRGVAGTVLVHKILGAAAHQGASLDEIKDLADKVVNNIKTIGLALSAATVPEVGKPGFLLDDNEIEYGVGIHSEPGYRREKMKTSYELATELVGKLKEEFKFEAGQKYGILVNGMGATPLMEQFIFMNDVAKLLTEENIEILFKKVGNYMTSIDMAGLSLTMIKLEDDQWLKNLNEDVKTISWG
ncbi:dihydroxyacetone kinase subunit DhaK [Lactococcus lactis subsp. lactis]|uniref:dihydroxyacetone kinase subunit DhaK n=1 Tax=Lactococcus lactis TaxID=1358 RepID=UPI000CE4446C|nr:dihydroxyacetone kinase subunit DhaK [Lactococcus lactis]PPA66832.1 dihydroxyacetone kinase subunit DhaK [Lactococcus lactis]QQF00350.1 dihydroxyacetone kinase subunit DhaK [Lactococcus lactis]